MVLIKPGIQRQRYKRRIFPLIAPLKWLGKLEKKISHSGKITGRILLRWLEAEYNAAQNRYLGLNQTESYTPSYFLMNIGISSEWKSRKQKQSDVQFTSQQCF